MQYEFELQWKKLQWIQFNFLRIFIFVCKKIEINNRLDCVIVSNEY